MKYYIVVLNHINMSVIEICQYDSYNSMIEGKNYLEGRYNKSDVTFLYHQEIF